MQLSGRREICGTATRLVRDDGENWVKEVVRIFTIININISGHFSADDGSKDVYSFLNYFFACET